MLNTPKGLRLQIGIFGKRNAGKSSLFNLLARQNLAIVSDTPGTTADPVEKAVEWHDLGPVLLIDTAGIDDDAGLLGDLRAEKTKQIFERVDLALIVTDGESFGDWEKKLFAVFREKKTPFIAVFNKCDAHAPTGSLLQALQEKEIPFVCMSARTGQGEEILRQEVILRAPEGFFREQRLLGDLFTPNSTLLFVTPIDIEAPKGRMILPQVQCLRDALDHHGKVIFCKEDQVKETLEELKRPPALVVTDSQVFGTVSPQVPQEIPLTSFSILMARLKGDLALFAAGSAEIVHLQDGDKILMAEACSHHPAGEDIGRVKIPNLLRKKSGKALEFIHVQGHDFPRDLSPYSLIVHCGACTFNAREMISRQLEAAKQGKALTNYGITIAGCLGILTRALGPFPEALDAYEKACNAGEKAK